VRAALEEDVAWGDVTTRSLIPHDLQALASVVFKEKGIVAGLPVLAATFREMDSACDVVLLAQDGAHVENGACVAHITGSAASLLTAERVALNFLQRLSGIATLTARFAAAVRGTNAMIVDTRKTTPGLRALEKYAVRAGGAHNHRFNLADGVLIKDNHLAAMELRGQRLVDAVRQARAHAPHTIKIEVETETLEQVKQALDARADIILLDNMDVALLREAVDLVGGKALTEASGGVHLDTVRAIAETGVDLISVGALTHSARALDISLDFSVA
jgi:nicotinate-nucleotide pyrophosphorylase (carboxylating)